MDQVVDYSFSHPPPAQIAAAGFVGALRYLAPSSPQTAAKVLTAPEVAALHAAGLAVGVVWESTADRAGQGIAAGRIDATTANVQADALGFPDDRPIYFAVDYQASPGQVAPYFTAAVLASRRPVGIYGHYGLIETFCGGGTLGWGWQCAAWSGPGAGTGGSRQGRRVSKHARLFQRVGYTLNNTSDLNDVLMADWGGWPTSAAPDPTPPRPPEEEIMPVQFMRAKSAPEVYEVSADTLSFDHVRNLRSRAYILSVTGVPILAPPPGAEVDVIDGISVWVLADDDMADIVS